MTGSVAAPKVDDKCSIEMREHKFILDFAQRIIPAIGHALPSTTEIVLHDLTLLPNSIVAVWGNITDCHVGGAPTDEMLELIVRGTERDLLGYSTELADGRRIQSSTILLKNADGESVGAICFNSDPSSWVALQKVVDQMAGGSTALVPVQESPLLYPVESGLESDRSNSPRLMQMSKESYPISVAQLTLHLINSAVSESGVSVDEMRKEHKVEVVRSLRERGIFLMRDAAETVAKAIKVSRFTVYNYIKELDGEEESMPDATSDEKHVPVSDSTGDGEVEGQQI